MIISKTVCVAILFLFLAAPSWAQDKAKKNAPNKPGVQNPAGKKRQPGADAKKGANPAGDKAGLASLSDIYENLKTSGYEAPSADYVVVEIFDILACNDPR